MKQNGKTGAPAPVTGKPKPAPAPEKAKASASATTGEGRKPPATPQPAAKASDQGGAGDRAPAAPSKTAASAPATDGRSKPAAPAKAKPAPKPEIKASSPPAKAETDKPKTQESQVPNQPAKTSAQPKLAVVGLEAAPKLDGPSKPKDAAPAAEPKTADATARTAYAQVQKSSEALRQAMTGAAVPGGLAEINGKLLDLVRTQTEATLEVWRSALYARSPAEAIQAQTNAMRKAYEDVTQRWKDLFETTSRVAGASFKPQQPNQDKDTKR